MYFPMRTNDYFMKNLDDMTRTYLYATGKSVSKEKLFFDYTKYYSEILSVMIGRKINYPEFKREFFTFTKKLDECDSLEEIKACAKTKTQKDVLDMIFFIKGVHIQEGKEEPTLTDIGDELFFFEEFIKWSKMKNVYKVDNDFAENVLQTKDFELLEEEVKHLPFNTFWLDLSSCDSFPCIDGVLINILEYEHPIIEMYQFTDDGKDVFFHSYYVTVKGKLIEEEIRNGMGDYEVGYATEDNSSNIRIDNTVLVLQILKYMASVDADVVQTTTKKKVNRVVGKSKPSDYENYEVGFVFGADFRKYKEQVQYFDSHSTGRKNRPHYVSAHWQRYHVGKGRTQTITKWIAPTFTGIDRDQVASFCTIHKMSS